MPKANVFNRMGHVNWNVCWLMKTTKCGRESHTRTQSGCIFLFCSATIDNLLLEWLWFPYCHLLFQLLWRLFRCHHHLGQSWFGHLYRSLLTVWMAPPMLMTIHWMPPLWCCFTWLLFHCSCRCHCCFGCHYYFVIVIACRRRCLKLSTLSKQSIRHPFEYTIKVFNFNFCCCRCYGAVSALTLFIASLFRLKCFSLGIWYAFELRVCVCVLWMLVLYVYILFHSF